ncbi:MAG: methylated-DNA--[protein]-cysteine S-methyltransferase [Spirochaetes bacterium]|nr:methylated-DNA--[protein]-cysteine S-methyltransferase [Spirochaetota bacterium]
MIYTCEIDTPLVPIIISAENNALTGLWFVGQKYYPAKTEGWINKPTYPVFKEIKVWIKNYFAGKNPSLQDLRLEPAGTDFQREVWEILLKIPYGAVTTYGEIAKQLAEKRGLNSMSAQAVGGAVGHNPISIIIPCHRVLGATGHLTGYAGGIDKKEALLRLEKAVLI